MNRDLLSAKELRLEDVGARLPNKKKVKAPKKKHSSKRKKKKRSRNIFELRKKYREEGKLGVWYRRIYLRSKLWKEVIRPRILERDSHMCVHCGCPHNLSVHHRCYHLAVLKGNRDNELETICRECHYKKHFD